jgi:TPR repeat protein
MLAIVAAAVAALILWAYSVDVIERRKKIQQAEQGDVEAQFRLGEMYARGRGVKWDDVEAVKWYKLAAEQGDADAQLKLGRMYAAGRGIKQSFAEATKWYRLAAEQGDVEAQFRLRKMYVGNRDVEQDYVEAVKWDMLAAEHGGAEAQLRLGQMYAAGRGVEQDYVEAVKWYMLAAEQGDASAQSYLGHMYAEGQGVEQDDVEAVKWCRLAAEQGYLGAQALLGDIYAVGRGGGEDDAEAAKWYKLAAEQGDVEAQHSLGEMYAVGRGVERDDVEAVKWYRLAAKQGHAPAQDRFLEMYAAGRGVERGDADAVRWYSLAAVRRDADAQDRRINQYLLPLLPSFSPAFEKDRIPPCDPDADKLFHHASWLYKKNLEKREQGDENSHELREAERLLRIATAWGHTKAANIFAVMLMNGLTAHDDRFIKPVEIAKDLIGRGIPYGYTLMGWMLHSGHGMKQDEEAAFQYFWEGAKLGNPAAQLLVGLQLVELDTDDPLPGETGHEMLRCAADQGHNNATYNAAFFLEEKEKYAEALKYYHLAVKLGGVDEADLLWRFFTPSRKSGLGLDKDEERAVRYEKISSALSNSGLGYRSNCDGGWLDYDCIPADEILEIDEIVPLPPAELPEWDGKIKYLDDWESGILALLPSEERIVEMALLKSLHPETGLPVKIDIPNSQLLDPETGEPLKTNLLTFRLLNRMRF